MGKRIKNKPIAGWVLGMVVLFFFPVRGLEAQERGDAADAFFIRKLHDIALTDGAGYGWLAHLTKEVGGRLSGSPEAAAAVEYMRQVMDTLGFDSVWLQPCMVPHWVRGATEEVRITRSVMGTVALRALALGNSVGTGAGGLQGEVLEVQGLASLEAMDSASVAGKIVFFNRPFDQRIINTFAAYGGAVDQRANGAVVAARKGAIGVLVRSMASGTDGVPHTGSMLYQDGVPRIPAFGIATLDADLLGRLLQAGPVSVYLRSDCRHLPDKLSYNVIGEIRGRKDAGKILLVGGHLDSWDVGEGAHDDGAGCVQSLDALRVLRRAGYEPDHTLRCVLFMNEENGLRGGTTYAAEAARLQERHLAAIESDRGGFTPRGFTVDGETEVFARNFPRMQPWLTLLEPYYLHIRKGGGGADISPLKPQGTLLIGFETDSQRYFDYHHTAADTLETVNKRELDLGTAAMASLLFLLDRYLPAD